MILASFLSILVQETFARFFSVTINTAQRVWTTFKAVKGKKALASRKEFFLCLVQQVL